MIYQNDVYMRTCSATVESIILKDDHAEIVLDQTIFFPEGGGQPSDTGWLVLNSGDGSHTNNEPHAGPVSKSKAKKRAKNEPVYIRIAEVHERDKVAYHKTAPFGAPGSSDMQGSENQISQEDLPQPLQGEGSGLDDQKREGAEKGCGSF